MRYSLRVVEMLAAARILSRHPGIEVRPRDRITLRDVVGRLGEMVPGLCPIACGS
jgi:hypothetical protein